MKEFCIFKSVINTIRNHTHNHYLVIESQTDYVSLWSFVFTLKVLLGDSFMLKCQMGFLPSVPQQSCKLQLSLVVRKMPKRNVWIGLRFLMSQQLLSTIYHALLYKGIPLYLAQARHPHFSGFQHYIFSYFWWIYSIFIIFTSISLLISIL